MWHFADGWPGQSKRLVLGALIAAAVLAVLAAGLIGTPAVSTVAGVLNHTGSSNRVSSFNVDPKQVLELVPVLPSVPPAAEAAQPVDTF